MLIVKFHNDGSGTESSANYNTRVLVNQRELYAGRVEGHNRADGWLELVKQFSGGFPAPTASITDVIDEILRIITDAESTSGSASDTRMRATGDGAQEVVALVVDDLHALAARLTETLPATDPRDYYRRLLGVE